MTESTLKVEDTDYETPVKGNESTHHEPGVLYCANHPNVETLLRCNRCGKPICLKCAELTDVGYRCKECIRSVQDVYFNAVPTDNIVAFVVAFLVTAAATPIAGLIFGIIPFLFLSLILAAVIGGTAGGVLAQIIRTAIGRRRGRYLRYYALTGIVIGVLLGGFLGRILLGIPLTLSLLIFAGLAAAAAFQILR